jgi:hypothetical protein
MHMRCDPSTLVGDRIRATLVQTMAVSTALDSVVT